MTHTIRCVLAIWTQADASANPAAGLYLTDISGGASSSIMLEADAANTNTAADADAGEQTALTAELTPTTALAKEDWAPSLNVFDSAQKEVMHLMQQNLWTKFVASPFYDSLVRQISTRATIEMLIKNGQISSALLQGTQQRASSQAGNSK